MRILWWSSPGQLTNSGIDQAEGSHTDTLVVLAGTVVELWHRPGAGFSYGCFGGSRQTLLELDPVCSLPCDKRLPSSRPDQDEL